MKERPKNKQLGPGLPDWSPFQFRKSKFILQILKSNLSLPDDRYFVIISSKISSFKISDVKLELLNKNKGQTGNLTQS